MATFDLENPNPNSGDALRDEAANILSMKYGRPVLEARTGGKKTDVLFRRQDFGKTTTIFVEAKDYTKRLGRADVSGIWADYSGLLRIHAPASLLIITKSGLTTDGQAYVEEQAEVRHQTIWELENEVFGLTAYVRSLTGLFEGDGLDRYYVPGRARAAEWIDDERRVDGPDIALFETLQTWIAADDHQPIAVLGGYGAGKSSFAKRLVAHQAAGALANPMARRPVLLSLGDYARHSSLEGLLGGKFTFDFPIDGFNTHNFLHLSDKGRLLVVLDGFDEMKHAMSWSDFRAQIGSLNRLTHGKAKVILLGRPTAFVSAEEHVHVLRGRKPHGDGFRRLPDWPEFREFDLEPFSAAERGKFVRDYLAMRGAGDPTRDAEWIDQRAREVNRLADHDPEVFSKPVHARILTDLAADPDVDLAPFALGVSRWSLYQVFFESLAEREVDKTARRPIRDAKRLDFLREIAFWLWLRKGGATSFSAHDIPDSLIEGLGSIDIQGFTRGLMRDS